MIIPSASFEYDEFVVSDSFQYLVKQIELTDMDKLKLFYLCQLVLQPVRDKFGPVRILSGKRSPQLNFAVGGSKTSDHLYIGETCAADFTIKGNVKECFEWVQANRQGTYGQLIHYPSKNFIHVSLPSGKSVDEAFEL